MSRYVDVSPHAGLVDRFWSQTDRASGCWNWTGTIAVNGYGTIHVAGLTMATHRLAWELSRGPISRGHHVLHRCDNRRCVNPDHLFIGTNRDNVRDKLAKGRQPRGERSSSAKLTDGDARDIRNRYVSGESAQSLASLFCVSREAVCCVLRGETFADAGGPIQTKLVRRGGGSFGEMAGERNPCAKITDDQARQIRARYASGEALQKDLAREFGIARSTVSQIANGRRRA